MSTPTVADIERIAAGRDIVLRNLLITHCYHELSLGVRNRINDGANWCTFATWASKQAGRTIRREDLRATLRARLEVSPELAALSGIITSALRDFGAARSIGVLLDEIVRALDADAAFDRAAHAVAEGNLRVFEEIALHFARFLESSEGAGPTGFGAFLERLRPGDPPAGQRLLRDAFVAYDAAMTKTEPMTRAQLLYYGNLLIGLHEQTRLQPQIEAAMNAAFDQAAVRRRVLTALLPGRWRVLRSRIAALFGRRPPLDEVLDRLLPLIQLDLRRVITAEAMTLQLPAGEVVRLGRDVKGAFPTSLATLSHPLLVDLLQRIDPTPDSVTGSGTTDWSDLADRMHLIADLFRCRQEWAPLFEPPFTPAQLDALRGNRRPPDPL